MGFLSTSLASYPHRGTKSSSSSSDSGIGGSVSTYRSSLGSVGSQLSSYSTFGDDESCPRTSGYYYGTDAHSQCSLIFRQSTAMWSCPSKFGLPEEFEFARVNFDKRSLPDYDYYPLEWYTDKENGVLAGEKDTTVDFDSSCKKILIADAYDFAYFNWRQYEDGPTQRDELRAPRVQGHYIGQGDFDRCRINSVVDKDKKRWCMMKCVDQAKIPTPFEGPLLCWVSPPKRSSSSSRIDLPQFNTLDLKYKSSDIPRNELSVEISGDGLIMNLKDSFPSPRDGVFEWDSTDIIASPPKQPPVPRTSGNYFGEGKYRKCYFQFRNVGKKYAIMRCPRSDDRWSIPDAFLNHTFVYGVKENDGPGRLYSEIELFDKTDGNSPIGSKVDIKYDNSKIKLTFIGYDTPFYFTWSPMSGETGGAITLPFETGYYALPPREYPHMYLRRPLATRPQAAVSSTSIIAVSVTLGILTVLALVLYWQRESMVVVDLQERLMHATGEAVVWMLESPLGRLLLPSVNIENIKRRFGIDEASKLPFSWMAAGPPQAAGPPRDQRSSRAEDQIELMADERAGIDGIDTGNPDLLYGDSFDVFPVTNWQTVQTTKLKRSAEPCLWGMDVLEGDDTWCHLDRERLRVGDTIYEILNEAEDPKTVLSNFPLPLQDVCIVEFTIENLLDHQKVSIGISPKPIPLGEWAGHFPYSLGLFNDGSIFAGDWRSPIGTMLGGFASGDVITMIVKRKYGGAKLNGAAVLFRNGDLCGNACPVTMESLRVPLDGNEEPKIYGEDCERMVFGYRSLKGTDYEISSPVPMRPPRPNRAEWGYLPAPYIAISVAEAEATSPVKVVVNFGADPFAYARESISKVAGLLGLEGELSGSMDALGYGNSLLVDEMERYVQLRTAKILRMRASADEPPSPPREVQLRSPAVVPEPSLPVACENLPSAVEGVSSDDTPSPRYIDLSDRCRFVPLDDGGGGAPCDCAWFTLGAAHGICGRCGHDRLWHKPGPGEKRILLSEPATSRPSSPQRQSTPDETSPLDERWLALDGRMGDWRHAMVVGDEVWYNVKTREVTSERPEIYRHRKLRPPAVARAHTRRAEQLPSGGVSVTENATEKIEGKLDTFRGPVVDAARRSRRRHVVRLGITKTKHRIGNDPLKLSFNRTKI
ncbi:hypothetical protein FOL47_005850 [Perkinsus chesapeaki]|uniref:Uncharacterized protein n=1 Tax=Perkinsus chesapeaki TaxID=330153 RepID=A0A7J6LVE0_PERCH|nr:hypothetical protein FOL47_005850 [Perkinsus chesapeaki]